MRNTTINLAISMFVWSEPMPPLYKTDGYDVIMMEEVKVLPKKFSSWDKTHI